MIAGVEISKVNYAKNLLLTSLVLSFFHLVFYPVLKGIFFPVRILTFNLFLVILYIGQIFLLDLLLDVLKISSFQALLWFAVLDFFAQKILVKK